MIESVDREAPNADEQRFAANLLYLRESRGWSQTELARQMVAAGWDAYNQMTVSRTEKGERPIRLSEARALANIMETSMERMVSESDQLRDHHRLLDAHLAVDDSMRDVWQDVQTLYANIQDVEDLLQTSTAGQLALPTENGTTTVSGDNYRAWLALSLARKISASGGYAVENPEEGASLSAIPGALLALSYTAPSETDDAEQLAQRSYGTFEEDVPAQAARGESDA